VLKGRSGFDFLAESDQKTLKVGNHGFPAWLQRKRGIVWS